eukprot:8249-Heterococcus_DN1.PRE.2
MSCDAIAKHLQQQQQQQQAERHTRAATAAVVVTVVAAAVWLLHFAASAGYSWLVFELLASPFVELLRSAIALTAAACKQAVTLHQATYKMQAADAKTGTALPQVISDSSSNSNSSKVAVAAAPAAMQLKRTCSSTAMVLPTVAAAAAAAAAVAITGERAAHNSSSTTICCLYRSVRESAHQHDDISRCVSISISHPCRTQQSYVLQFVVANIWYYNQQAHEHC